MPFTRTYNWGESLRLEAAMSDGGLKAATDRIAANMGRAYGSRSTFATLFDLAEPPTATVPLTYTRCKRRSGTGRSSPRRSICGGAWNHCGCRWLGGRTRRQSAHNRPYVNLGMCRS